MSYLPTIKFSTSGNYTAVFKAIGKDGSAGASKPFTINPNITFSVTGGDCEAPCEVTVTASQSGLAEYEWEWNDGTPNTIITSLTPTAKHIYTRESPSGGFPIGLFVKYKSGDSQTFAYFTTVNIKPTATIANKVTHAWSAGGIYSEEGRKIITDPSGNVYVAGRYIGGPVSFGRDVNNNEITLPSVASINNFVSKYTNTGVIIWAKTYRIEMGMNNNFSSSAGLISDLIFANNSVYASFNNSSQNNTVAEPRAGILTINPQNGSAGAINLTYPRDLKTVLTYEALAADNAGNIYVGGSFNNSLVGKNYDDLSLRGFVVKYNSSGAVVGNPIVFVTEKDSPSNTSSIVYDLAVAKDNTLYFMGNFTGKYGTGDYVINANGKNTFLSKFKADFTTIDWVRQDESISTTNSYNSYPRGLILDNDDNIFMLGSIENGSSIKFKSGSKTLTNRSGSTVRDNYLVKYDKNGTVSFFDYASKANYGVDAIAKDAKGDIITTGFRCNISKFSNAGTPIYQDVFLTTSLDNSANAITSDA
ncbi:MAG: hypothetical protein U5N85_09925 [Arcicella sp.]|nr:hypothetical protein [Arcicella sp.]